MTVSVSNIFLCWVGFIVRFWPTMAHSECSWFGQACQIHSFTNASRRTYLNSDKHSTKAPLKHNSEYVQTHDSSQSIWQYYKHTKNDPLAKTVDTKNVDDIIYVKTGSDKYRLNRRGAHQSAFITSVVYLYVVIKARGLLKWINWDLNSLQLILHFNTRSGINENGIRDT